MFEDLCKVVRKLRKEIKEQSDELERISEMVACLKLKPKKLVVSSDSEYDYSD